LGNRNEELKKFGMYSPEMTEEELQQRAACLSSVLCALDTALKAAGQQNSTLCQLAPHLAEPGLWNKERPAIVVLYYAVQQAAVLLAETNDLSSLETQLRPLCITILQVVVDALDGE
jgi:hypothetical protein